LTKLDRENKKSFEGEIYVINFFLDITFHFS